MKSFKHKFNWNDNKVHTIHEFLTQVHRSITPYQNPLKVPNLEDLVAHDEGGSCKVKLRSHLHNQSSKNYQESPLGRDKRAFRVNFRNKMSNPAPE
jgi:hypothetical protein